MADEAAITWLKVLKQNDWGKNREVDWILTHTGTQLEVERKITDVAYNYPPGYLQIIQIILILVSIFFSTVEVRHEVLGICYASGNI